MKYLFIIFAFSLPLLSMSQSTKAQLRRQRNEARKEHINQLIRQEEEGALIFQKQSIFGLKFNTDGFGFLYEHGKYKKITRTNIWWLELAEKKQQSQQRQTPQPIETNYSNGISVISVGNSFVFGKQNNFYNFNFGIGRQLLIGGKGNTNGVAVSAIYGGGISFGLLKPYFLQVYDSSTATYTKDIKYDDDQNRFLDPNYILGSSGFGKGWDQVRVIPGWHTRAALRFDYGRFREVVSAVEIGININYYARNIAIMALNEKHQLFFNAYAQIAFGRRR